MSAAKHSAAPWELVHNEDDRSDSLVIGGGGQNDDIAEVFSSERDTVRQPYEEAVANARLIIAAPAYWEAAELFFASLGGDDHAACVAHHRALGMLRHAHAQASGAA